MLDFNGFFSNIGAFEVWHMWWGMNSKDIYWFLVKAGIGWP